MEWQQQYIENQLTMNAITKDQKMSRQCAMNLMIQMLPGNSIFLIRLHRIFVEKFNRKKLLLNKKNLIHTNIYLSIERENGGIPSHTFVLLKLLHEC